MYKDIIQREGVIVLALTAASYAIAVIYETARYRAFGINLNIIAVHPISLIVAFIFLLIGVALYRFLRVQIEELFTGRMDDKVFAVATSDRTRGFIISLVLLAIVSLLSQSRTPLLVGGSSETPTGLVAYMLWVMPWVISLFTLYALIILFYRYKFSKNSETYRQFLKQGYQSDKEKYAVYNNVTIAVVGTLTTLSLCMFFGTASPYTNTTYDTFDSETPGVINVIIDDRDGDYLIKRFDEKNNKFLDGYTVYDIVGKEIQTRELAAT